jgi:Holliday junction resolvase RusA-like endonuclease
VIHVDIPFFPPSANNAYFTRGKLRVLSTEGKKYKNDVQNFLGRQHPEFLSFFAQKDMEYEMIFILFFEPGTLYNKTWPQTKDVSRHKKIDASNRAKLLEDILAKAAGYDDSQHFSVTTTKGEALPRQQPYVEVWAWREEENGPIARFLTTRTTGTW